VTYADCRVFYCNDECHYAKRRGTHLDCPLWNVILKNKIEICNLKIHLAAMSEFDAFLGTEPS
jgi:hypothetical protein